MIDVHLITDSKPFWQDASWLAAAAGVAALILSGVTTWLGLRHQKAVTLLQLKYQQSENWVADFRNDLTTFVANQDNANGIVAHNKAANKDITPPEMVDQIIDKVAAAHTMRMKLQLYLDLKNPLHSEMSDLLNSFSQNANDWRVLIQTKPELGHPHVKRASELRTNILTKANEIITQKYKNSSE